MGCCKDIPDGLFIDDAAGFGAIEINAVEELGPRIEPAFSSFPWVIAENGVAGVVALLKPDTF